MPGLEPLRELLPAYAKDVRLTLEAAVGRSPLPPNEAAGCAIAAAFAAGSGKLVELFAASGALDAAEAEAAKIAGSLMGMNNIWYRYLELAADRQLMEEEPGFRMTAYSTHGGVDERRFAMYCLAASIVGGCRSCVASHAEEIRKTGASVADLREIGRIASAVNAAAKAIAVG